MEEIIGRIFLPSVSLKSPVAILYSYYLSLVGSLLVCPGFGPFFHSPWPEFRKFPCPMEQTPGLMRPLLFFKH